MSLADALWRRGLRVAWLGLQGWWWIRRPQVDGAAVLVRVDRRILLVRHSYQPRLGLPGGHIRRGESPRRAAARELAEEVGLRVAPEQLTPLLDRVFRHSHIRNRVVLFELRLPDEPALALDRREVVATRFATETEALGERLWPPLAQWLAERHTGRGS